MAVAQAKTPNADASRNAFQRTGKLYSPQRSATMAAAGRVH